jgi:hypothetical protein
MSYSPGWSNANGEGRLEPGEHSARLSDASELAAAINRRRELTYQDGQDFSSHVAAGEPVRASTVATAAAPPFDNLRDSLSEKVLSAPTGTGGGEPATPAAMDWLWPLADDDEDKVIVSGQGGVGGGEVGLFQKLTGTTDWTDPTLTAGETDLRAVHFNELRQVTEWLRRGRWDLPVYLAAGLYSPLPDTPWAGYLLGNTGAHEVRCAGWAVIRTGTTPDLGVTDATVRSSTYLQITADTDCTVEVYRCLRALEFAEDPPTWNEYDPSESAAWSAPGGTGEGDASLIGSVELTADEPGALSGEALADAVQAMVNGAEQNFLLRRSDTGSETIAVEARLVVEFDLNGPPS